MKNLILASLLMTLSTSAMAIEATPAESKLLCAAIERDLEQSQADMGLDIEACEANQKITARNFGEGYSVVQGKLKFNAPERPGFKLKCAVLVRGEPRLENVVGQTNCN